MYADYAFYTNSYYGTLIAETDFDKYGSCASDFLDWVTRHHLTNNLPSDAAALNQVKKACCAIADALYEIDAVKNTQATAGAAAGLNQGGTVQSISSGGESISFELSAMEKAVSGGQDAINAYLYTLVRPYLSMVADDNGNYYLFWGLG